MHRRLRFVVVVAVAAALVSGGCRRGDSGDGDDSGLDRRLGAAPSTLVPDSIVTGVAPDGTSTTMAGGGGVGSAPGPGGDASGGGGGAAPGGAASSPCGGYKPAASLPDGTGDAGIGAPAYADVTAVAVDDDGDRIRVSVSVNGPLPPALGERETLGFGLDLYQPQEREGTHQLFVQGDTDGWLAYLHTPEGLVDYPGTFALGGNQLVLTMPWSALSRSLSSVSLFADWSKPAIAVNTGGSDRTPANGTTPLRRCAATR